MIPVCEEFTQSKTNMRHITGAIQRERERERERERKSFIFHSRKLCLKTPPRERGRNKSKI